MYKDILEARYTNDQKDTILILHVTESDGIIEEYIQPGSVQHQAVEERGWTEEKLVDATAEFKREQLARIAEVAKTSAAAVYNSQRETAQKELDKVTRKLNEVRHRTIEAEALYRTKREEFDKAIEKQQKKLERKENEVVEARRRIVEAETLYKVRRDELDQIRHKTIAAEALHKIKTEEHTEQLEKSRRRVLESEALVTQKKEQFEEYQKKSLEAHAVVKKIENEAPEKIRSINKYVNDNLTTEKLDIALENFLVFVKTVNENQEAIDILVNKTGKKVKPKTVLDAVKHLL